MILHNAATWCANAAKLVSGAHQALTEFDEKRQEAERALLELVDHAGPDTPSAKDALVRHGVAATLRNFEERALSLLSFRNFDSYKRVEKALTAFGQASEEKWTARDGGGELPAEIETLANQIEHLRQEMAQGRSGAVDDFEGPSLFALLDAIQKTAPSARPAPAERSAFYVPKHKRGGRFQVAAWTLGILLLLALSIQGIFLFIFLGVAAVFGAQFVITTSADDDDRKSEQEMVGYEVGVKGRLRDLNVQVLTLLEKLLHDMEHKLDETALAASRACDEMLAFARSATNATPPETSLIFGECAVSPLIGHMNGHANAGFLNYAAAGLALGELIEDPEPIGGCIAHMPLGACDAVEVFVDAEADPSAVGTMLAAATLRASKHGKARFMFIEAGRLAEAYRVFGALNESASTRLAERLYITHLSELSDAVDALRTFVGRTKEAVTRRADSSRRIGMGDADESSFLLQRAIVVLDETQQQHWPEKDRRRLSEYFAEIRALAQVGAREGSVFLIALTQTPDTTIHHSPVTGDRSVRVRAGEYGIMFQNLMLSLYPPTESAAKIGAECDAWVKEAKKADSTLRQTNTALDWSDTEASNTRHGIEVDIGRHGADRPAKLLLGREGAHHAICIGRTGSGKTTLFHVIISNLVRRYSPDELELYLLDFKEGVEFAVYADLALPHCRAVAIDADRGFGLSVLSHLKRELNRRASIFKAAGVGIASLERYEEETGNNMPRIVLLIDEFQVLLQAGERTPGAASGAAAAALEDLVRRGRSFGLHVILGSQTLAGRELTAATLGQLAVRIVLPCSAPDAAMLLGEQPISGQLRAPGDAIVWRAGQGDVSDAHLAKIFAAELNDLPALAEACKAQAASEGKPVPSPFVFRGSGQNDLGEVMPHLDAVRRERNEDGASIFAVGAATSYGERPAGLLRNARARNLLFVHRADETRADFLYSAIESALLLDSSCRAIVCDLEQSKDFSGDDMASRLQAAFPGRVDLVEPSELGARVEALADAVRQPLNAARTIFAIGGSARTNLARSAAFATILREGPETGLHVFATCDSVKNLERLVERSAQSEFGLRALGPASAGDSQTLLDSNDAEALSADHHYLLFDDGASGRLVRLQVLTPSMQHVEAAPVQIAEVGNV